MAYDGSGSIFALGARICRLDADGTPTIGTTTCYVTDSIIQSSLGIEYADGDEIEQKNGSGLVCLTYKAPDTVKRGTIEDFQFCSPDPNVLAFVMGGSVITQVGPPTEIGYAAPLVGVNPTPNGVSIEMWSRNIIGGAVNPTLPYMHWIIPRAYLRLAEGFTLSAESGVLPQFEGFSVQNQNWGNGPGNDWTFTSDRIWAFAEKATIPTLTPSFVAVA